MLKIVGFEKDNALRLGAVDGDGVIDLQAVDARLPSDLGRWLAENDGDLKPLGDIAKRAPSSARLPLANVTFAPAQLTVKVGTTVTWINEDDIPHTVVATGKAFRSKALDTDDKFTFTLTTPGSYEYFCSLHPHMKAMVTVVGQGTGE